MQKKTDIAEENNLSILLIPLFLSKQRKAFYFDIKLNTTSKSLESGEYFV